MILKNFSIKAFLCLFIFNLVLSQSDIKESSNFFKQNTYSKKQAYNSYNLINFIGNLFC